LEAKGPAEVEQALGAGFDITIVADNDFYSQQDQVRINLRNPQPLSSSDTTGVFFFCSN
jgi:hypothetical protein